LKKKICNFGFNDSIEDVRSTHDNYLIYAIWVSMIHRCYNPNVQVKMPTYIGCVVDERWRSFSSFREWVSERDWKGKHLDKDLLSPNGHKKYGPDTCVFIDSEINQFMKGDQKQGVDNGLPAGVHWSSRSKKYVAQSGSKPRKHLGYFNCPDSAHSAYNSYRRQKAIEISHRICDNVVRSAFLLKYNSEVIL